MSKYPAAASKHPVDDHSHLLGANFLSSQLVKNPAFEWKKPLVYPQPIETNFPELITARKKNRKNTSGPPSILSFFFQ